MIKIKFYRNYFGKVTFMQIKNFECSSENIWKIVSVFNPQLLLISILTLDMDSNFTNTILINKDQYKAIMPTENTITSETVIVTKKHDFLSVLDLLVESEPRCMTLYEVKNEIEFNDNLFHKKFQNADSDKLVDACIADYAISVIFEESFVNIAINSKTIDSNKVVDKIKMIFKWVYSSGKR